MAACKLFGSLFSAFSPWEDNYRRFKMPLALYAFLPLGTTNVFFLN